MSNNLIRMSLLIDMNEITSFSRFDFNKFFKSVMRDNT